MSTYGISADPTGWTYLVEVVRTPEGKRKPRYGYTEGYYVSRDGDNRWAGPWADYRVALWHKGQYEKGSNLPR